MLGRSPGVGSRLSSISWDTVRLWTKDELQYEYSCLIAPCLRVQCVCCLLMEVIFNGNYYIFSIVARDFCSQTPI